MELGLQTIYWGVTPVKRMGAGLERKSEVDVPKSLLIQQGPWNKGYWRSPALDGND